MRLSIGSTRRDSASSSRYAFLNPHSNRPAAPSGCAICSVSGGTFDRVGASVCAGDYLKVGDKSGKHPLFRCHSRVTVEATRGPLPVRTCGRGAGQSQAGYSSITRRAAARDITSFVPSSIKEARASLNSFSTNIPLARP